MANYLNNLNQIIKINTAAVSNTENKDAFLLTTKRSRDDLNKIANYINNLIVPAFKSLASGPRYTHDAAQVGISGLTVVTYPEAQGNNSFQSGLYWKQGLIDGEGRPCTVKESFDYLFESVVDRIVEVREATNELSGIIDEIACTGFNLVKLQKDTVGLNYELNCSINSSFQWPLAKHLYEIISQLTTGIDISLIQNLNDGSSYPSLSLNLDRSLGLNDLTDVSVDGVSQGQALVYNNGTWVPGNVVSQEATEEVSGTLEVATTRDIALMAGPSDSSSGNSYLAVTTENLLKALEIDAVEFGETNLLRESIKDVAFEKLQESSIFDLADVNNPNILANKHTLIYDSTSQKFINRLIVWEDIQMRPSVTEAQLYSSTQNSNIINTKQDYTSEEKDNLLKSHNTLSYKKTSNKWEIAKYKDYKSLSPAISYGVDVFKSTVSLPGYLNKKVPFTLAFAYKNERYFPQGNIIVAPGIQLPYVQYSSEVEETVSLFDELKDPKSRVMSSHSLWWEEGIEAFYNMGTSPVGVYRTDKAYERTQGSYFLNPNNIENSFFNIYKNLTTETDIMTEGESLVMILGTYNVSDKLYACPSYINRRYGLVNKEVTFCISDTYFNQGLTSYLTAEGFSNNQRETISNEVLNEKNFIGVVTKKYNYDSEVGERVDLGSILGVVDYGLNISDSHKLCADLLDIDGNFSTGNTFYEFIEDLWASKYPATKDLFDPTQREAIAPLVEFSLAYCKLKL